MPLRTTTAIPPLALVLAAVVALLLPAHSRAQTTTAPACQPAVLNNSAQLAGVTVTPAPESMDASFHTQISLLGVPASGLAVTEVLGSVSGQHSGRLTAYSQGDGASFIPDLPFSQGESVTVRAIVPAAQARQHASRGTSRSPTWTP